MIAQSGIPGRLVQLRTLGLNEDTVEISESNSICGNELLKFSCVIVFIGEFSHHLFISLFPFYLGRPEDDLLQ